MPIVVRRSVLLMIGVCLCSTSCLTGRLRERASSELGCDGGVFTSSAKDSGAIERDDGTTYRFCCKNDRHNCAEYFCPDNPKAGCNRLE